MKRWVRAVGAMLLLAWGVIANAAPADAGALYPAGAWRQDSVRFVLVLYFPKTPKAPMLQQLDDLLKRQPGLQRVEKLSERPAQPELRAIWRTDARGPSENLLRHFSRGLTEDQKKALTASRHELALVFAHPGAQALPAYRRALEVVSALAEQGDAFIWDDETRLAFTPASWKTERLTNWQGELPMVRKHVSVHLYANPPGMRAVSLGMAKFGLPDVVATGFGQTVAESVNEVLNALMQAMAEGQFPRAAGWLELGPLSLRHEAARALHRSLMKEPKPSRLILRVGRRDDGDPDNALVELRFGDDADGATHGALLEQWFALERKVIGVRHDEELLAARDAARARLPDVRTRFQRGLPLNSVLMVKAPFKSGEDGVEWMWVEVLKWEGEHIEGLLNSRPMNIPTLRAGQTVRVRQGEVFDYLLRLPNGQSEGNETSRIIERMRAAQPLR